MSEDKEQWTPQHTPYIIIPSRPPLELYPMSSANRTYCKHGHPWVAENLYTIPKTGQLVCRECVRQANRRASPTYKKELDTLKRNSKRLDADLHEAIAQKQASEKIAALSLACLEAYREIKRFTSVKKVTLKEAEDKSQKAKIREQKVAERKQKRMLREASTSNI